MRVLIVRLSSLGDVVHAAPVLVDIAHAHPAARIDWVVEEAFVPLARCFAGIERIVPIALRRWRRRPLASRHEIAAFWQALRRERYDAIEDKAWRAGAYWEPRTAVLQASEAAPPSVDAALQAWKGVA